MATAERKTVEIEKMIPTKVNEDRVILQLTPEEADELLTFLRAKHWPSALSYPLTSGVLSALANQEPVEAPDDRPIRVGDRVKILDVRFVENPSRFVNRVGTVSHIDPRDRVLTYEVEFEDNTAIWAKSVERVGS